jgi:hypothetical protein
VITTKKVILAIATIGILLLVFRGPLFRCSVVYVTTGERPASELKNVEIIRTINPNHHLTTAEMVDVAMQLTNERLSFSRSEQSNDPNDVLKMGTANCIGYSAVFNSIMNHLIQVNRKSDSVKAQHLVGGLEFIGVDLHQFIESPFFKDHDFNKVVDLQTGEEFYVDPSVSDILRINRIKAREKRN